MTEEAKVPMVFHNASAVVCVHNAEYFMRRQSEKQAVYAAGRTEYRRLHPPTDYKKEESDAE